MSERTIHILTDSFWKILLPGLKVTLPLTAIAFAMALVIAIFVALIQFANVKVLKQINPFVCAAFVLAINEGAYCAETMRAALEAVPVGQLEAGYCAGMKYHQIIRRIVLPQAMRTAFPPLSNSLLSMMKDTSLVASITVAEMFMAAQRIVARTYEPLLVYTEVALMYLAFSTVLTWLQHLGEKRLNRYRGAKKAAPRQGM